MADATVNSKNENKMVGVESRTLTFAATGDTYVSDVPVKDYQWSLVSYTGANAGLINISESSGTFTLSATGEIGGTTPTEIKVNLWIATKQ
jgi:hypothetical protein